jgi:hypothetical protein
MVPTAFIVIILIIAAAGGLIYWSMNKKSTTTTITVKQNDTPSGTDTIIITNSGSKKESFIDSPHRVCVKSNSPDWCSNFPLTEPISYWYDAENFDNTSQSFEVIDETSGECLNPTDCIKFTEVLDDNMNLIDIKSADGKSYIITVIDDIYNLKLRLPDTFLNMFDIDFDTGVLAPAPNSDGTIPKDADGNPISIKPGIEYPLGTYIAVLVSKYKQAGKPKPNIKFEFESGTAGQILDKTMGPR